MPLSVQGERERGMVACHCLYRERERDGSMPLSVQGERERDREMLACHSLYRERERGIGRC